MRPKTSAVLIIGLALQSNLAFAATADGQDEQQGSRIALEEIVVTASKRSQSIQSAPVAVTAIQGDVLEQQGMLEQLASTVPGLAVTNAGPGQTRIALRGISGAGSNFVTQATVGYYMDESPVTMANTSFAAQIDPSFYDLSRIEVLRGPQGTLYGAGSLAGTVKLVFNQPNLSRFESRTRASVSSIEGGGTGYGADAVLNIPVVEGKSALRTLAYYKENAGYVDHRFLDGSTDKDANKSTTGGVRALLRYEPTDSWTFTPSIFYQRTEYDSRHNYDISATGSPSLAGYFTEPGEDELVLGALTINADFAKASLTSVTSYYDRGWSIRYDFSEFDMIPSVFDELSPSISLVNTDARVISHETRLASVAETGFRWTVGVFFSDEENQQFQRDFSLNLNEATGGVLDGIDVSDNNTFHGLTHQDVEQYAAFSEIGYRFQNGLELAVGGRYFRYETNLHRELGGYFIGPVGQEYDLPGSDTGFVPKVHASYQLTESAMVYALASEGYRLGGGNIIIPLQTCADDLADLGYSEAPREFEPDSARNYEIGGKTEWLDRRIRLNASLYEIRWEDVQLPVFLPCGYTFFDNASSARSRGVEVEGQWRITPAVTLGGTYSHISAEYTADELDGQRLLNTPESTGSVFLEISKDFRDDWTGSVRFDYSYYGDVLQTTSPFAIRPMRPSYEITQLQLGLAKGRWEATAFIYNIFNEEAFTSLEPFDTSFYYLPLVTATSLPPRTYGLSIAASF